MSLPRTPLLLATAFAVALVPVGFAEPPRPEPEAARIARLIDQLGSESFTEREAATKALREIGEPALGALRKVAAESHDAEVRRRSGLLVRWTENLDYQKLQGTWTVSKLVEEGRSYPADDLKATKVVFAGDELRLILGDASLRSAFRLNPHGRPKEIDLGRPREFEAFPDTPSRGIYRFDGEQLTVCVTWGLPGKRPTQFVAEPNSKTSLCILRRPGGVAPKLAAGGNDSLPSRRARVQ